VQHLKNNVCFSLTVIVRLCLFSRGLFSDSSPSSDCKVKLSPYRFLVLISIYMLIALNVRMITEVERISAEAVLA
jgi:hypothetical protein